MSGALWFYFWSDDAPVNSNTSTAVSVLAPSLGSGAWPYRPLDDEFWNLWAARFAPVDLAPHAQFDLQAQLADLRKRLQRESASAVAEAKLNAEVDDLNAPSLF